MTASDEAGRGAPEHALERLVFFSDAVFAIAITLLIIEIHIPELENGATNGDFLRGLAQLTPNFIGFFVSFAVIGAFWSGHHRAFGLAATYSPKLVGTNLQMLCAIVFMPFATAFMSTYYGETVPAALYAITLLVTGLLNQRLVFMATSAPVVGTHATPADIAHTRARTGAVILGSVGALIVAFIDARFSQIALIAIPLWQILLARHTNRTLARAA